jgi:hypothetical protein
MFKNINIKMSTGMFVIVSEEPWGGESNCIRAYSTLSAAKKWADTFDVDYQIWNVTMDSDASPIFICDSGVGAAKGDDDEYKADEEEEEEEEEDEGSDDDE